MEGEIKKKIEKIIENFKETVSKKDTTTVSTELISDLKIKYNNENTLLKYIAALFVEDGKIAIESWDHNALKNIESALNDKNFNFFTGKKNIIYVNVPISTKEKRENIAKEIKQLLEKYKISIRNIRTKEINNISEESMSKDDIYMTKNKIDKIIKEGNKKISEEAEKHIKKILNI